METAKVDVRKLQLLNDRINQCIDALNQVRTSVHGLAHAPATSPLGVTAPAVGYFDSHYNDPRVADPRFGYGISPAVPGFGTGLSHTSLPQIPMTGYAPVGGVGGINSVAGQIPITSWNTPFGLSHTPVAVDPTYSRPLWADPLLAARVAQTFPFVQFALPPVVPVY